MTTPRDLQAMSRGVDTHRFDDDDATYRDGFADGVKAAREAVAAMRPETDPDIAHVIVSDVLDAIDALEKPNA